MSRILRQITLVLVVASSAAAWAGFIRGQVKYANGQPADHVIIRLRSDVIAFQTETSTDPQGKFNFDGLPLTTFHLTIEGQGFRPYSNNIDISLSKMAYEQITLQPDRERGATQLPSKGPAGSVDARLELIPPQARKEFEAGEKFVNEKKDLEGAVKHFRKAIQLYETYPEAHLKLGLTCLDLSKYDEAQKELQRSIELDPTAPAAYLALGAMLNREKRYEEAERTLTRGLELKSDVPEGHYELAKSYWALGHWQDAEPHAIKAAALQPDMAPVHVLLGNIALRKRDAPGAVKEFQEYLRLDPKGPMAEGTQAMVKKIQESLNGQQPNAH